MAESKKGINTQGKTKNAKINEVNAKIIDNETVAYNLPTYRAVKKAEKDLLKIIDEGETNWARFFLIVKDIEVDKVYKDSGYRSFTGWVKGFCDKTGVSESIVWSRKIAGDMYFWIQKYKKEIEHKEIAPLEKADISVDSLVTLKKIFNQSEEAGIRNIDNVLDKKITREQLRNIYHQLKKEKELNKLDRELSGLTDVEDMEEPNTEEEVENISVDRATLMGVIATDRGWIGLSEKMPSKAFSKGTEVFKYKMVTELDLLRKSNVAKRVNEPVVIVENLSIEKDWKVAIHVITIMVTQTEIENFKDYSSCGDCSWVFVPIELLQIATEIAPEHCGILTYKDGHISVDRKSKTKAGTVRKNTLEKLVLKLV